MSAQEELGRIAMEIRSCTLCPLAKGRTRAVPGEGPADAEIMFIGEGPGFHEDRQGRPFVGAAGQFLEELLASIGMRREQVYITNVVKCFISPRVLIYTAEGYKPIKDVRVGDLVLTHTGHFRKVTYMRPQEVLPAGSEVVRLTISPPDGGKPVWLTVTPEHPFLVNGEWKPAREIQAGDRVSTLGDRCEVCGKAFFVRYDRYDIRTYRTCGPACHNKRIMHSPETRQKIRQTMERQYAEGLRDPIAITARANERTRELVAAGEAKIQRMTAEERYRGRISLDEYVFVEAVVTQVEHRRTRRSFPLYNIGVEADESYIAAGVVSHNCRPPGNRDPLPEELNACRPYLDRQIEVIKPKIVVTLGRYSMARYLPGASISRVHGQPRWVGDVICFPMFHPAAGLHQPRWKPLIEEDIKKLPALLAEARQRQAAESPVTSEEDKGEPNQYHQLSLF